MNEPLSENISCSINLKQKSVAKYATKPRLHIFDKFIYLFMYFRIISLPCVSAAVTQFLRPIVAWRMKDRKSETTQKKRKLCTMWAEGLSHRRTSCCYWVAEAVWSSARPIVAHFAVKQSGPRGSHRRGVNNSTGWNVGFTLMLSCECGFFGDTWSILCGKNQKYFHLFVFHYRLKLLCVTFSACYGILESYKKKKKSCSWNYRLHSSLVQICLSCRL